MHIVLIIVIVHLAIGVEVIGIMVEIIGAVGWVRAGPKLRSADTSARSCCHMVNYSIYYDSDIDGIASLDHILELALATRARYDIVRDWLVSRPVKSNGYINKWQCCLIYKIYLPPL